MFTVKEWVYGNSNNIPDWLNKEAANGRVKITKDEGEIVEVKLFTTSGPVIVNKDDVVILLKSGLVKLTKDQYEKFRKKEVNKNKEV